MGFNLGRFVRNAFNPKSGLRKTISKVASTVDRGITSFAKAARPIGAAVAAAVPEAAPVVGGIESALGSHERIRKAVAG